MRKNENENQNVSEKVKSVLSELEKFVTAEIVVGKPIKSDGVTVIPLVDVSFGLGFGFNGKMSEDMQGGGIGGSITPNSLLVIENGQTKLLSIKDSSSMTSLIPQILDRLDLDFIRKPDDSKKTIRVESEDEE